MKIGTVVSIKRMTLLNLFCLAIMHEVQAGGVI